MPGPQDILIDTSIQAGSFFQRKIIAKKVISSLEKFGYAYGEYVRNEVAGDDFNVVNFFSPKFMASNSAIKTEIINLGFDVLAFEPTFVEHQKHKFSETLFRVTNPNNYSFIFIKVRRPLDENNIPFTDVYSNVNHLLKNKDGTYSVHEDMFGGDDRRKVITNNILSDIKNRRFRLWNQSGSLGDDYKKEFYKLIDSNYLFLAGKDFADIVIDMISTINNTGSNVTDNFNETLGGDKIDKTPIDKSGWLDPALDKDIVSKTNPCCEIAISQDANQSKSGFVLDTKTLSKRWYKDGNLHREDGPAIEWFNGNKSWYKNGKLHRLNGPAVDNWSGNKAWYRDGLLHREDGPAFEGFDGKKEWWVNGKRVNSPNDLIKEINSGIGSFKNEMNKAVYRSVSCQLTNLIKSNIISFMKENGTDKNKLDIVAELLNTTGGTAMVSAMLGIGLPYVPKIGEDPRVAVLAEEFRVAGYSVAMNAVFSALMQYIAPEIIKAMKTLPPVETKRIVIDDLPRTVDDNELIEDEIDEETLTVSL